MRLLNAQFLNNKFKSLNMKKLSPKEQYEAESFSPKTAAIVIFVIIVLSLLADNFA